MAAKKLVHYNAKRDFKKTAEPSGKVASSRSGFSYLIQKHAASRLHYDFRLELDGVLKSWAVTRGPSLDPHDRRLAVEVEDHPVAYGTFEGIIPQGEYGGGTVMLWDRGTWEPLGDPKKELKKGSLHFKLHGERLQGEWTLVRMKDRPSDKGRHNWLLLKRTDKHAKPGKGEAFLQNNATSIVSGRRMEAIASEADRTWQSKPAKKTAGQSARPKASKHKAIHLPEFIPPQLATLTDAMPSGGDWVHEVKFDGYRTLAYLHNGTVRLLTRNGLDWTEKYGRIPRELEKFPATAAILDGELVQLDGDRISSFSALKNALSSGGADLSYYAFDLLYLDGEDLRDCPLIERKAALEACLKKARLKHVFYSEHFTAGDEFLTRACALRMEGVISKRADAPYHSGRGKTWLKTKCHQRQEFVIGGYTPSTAGKGLIGSLLLGYYDGKDFVYAGRVGTGFTQQQSRDIYRMLHRIERKTMAYTRYSDAGRRGPGWKRGVVWTDPHYVCEVEFTEWTQEGALRHPSFQGLREDKPASRITRDAPMAVAKAKQAAQKEIAAETKRMPGEQKKAAPHNDGVVLTSPDKILFPEDQLTKQDLADYYTQVAEWMLPHVAGRPLSLVRCPEGSKKPCFFQRHSGSGLSSHIEKLKLYPDEEPYVTIRDADGLQTLVQMGVLEIHAWGSHVPTWEKPDLLVFDFDPDTELKFSAITQAALEMRERLAALKLESFVKTTGGKGLHVVVPITPHHPWDRVKQFTRQLAEAMAADSPEKYTTNIRKAARKGRIFIDYLRNGETATAIAPYSSRARAHAPVAVPLRWEELSKLKDAHGWTIETLPKRLSTLKSDPWDALLTTKQTLRLKD